MLRPARALVAALSLSLLALAPTPGAWAADEPTGPTGEPAGDPMAGAPEVGTCYQLTHDELMAVATPAEPVDCGKRHTARVLDVLTLPESLDWDSSDKRVSRKAVKACAPAFAAVVKDDPKVRARTLAQFAYFYPDAAEQDAGARWFRCDVSLRAAETMLPLPEELPRVRRAARIDDSFGRCVTRKNAYTTCTKRHRHEHSGSFLVDGVRPRTAQRRLAEAAHRGCPKRTTGSDWIWSAAPAGKRRYVVVCYQRA